MLPHRASANAFPFLAALLIASAAPAGPAALPQVPAASPAERSLSQARSVLRRFACPAPDRARMARALAVAGVDLGAAGAAALDKAFASAAAAHAAWRPDAERALLARLSTGFEAAPLAALPASCVRPVIDAWDQGLRFESDAFAALLAASPAAGSDAAALAVTVLRGLQWQAIAPIGGQAGMPDLRARDLLEAVACRGADGGMSPPALRAACSGYAADRARLLRNLAEAAVEAEARRADASRVASAWSEARTARDADPAQDVLRAGDWRPIAMVLQMAPVLVASAELVDLQRRTASQVASTVDPGSAWCLYEALLAPGPACRAYERLAEFERLAAEVPAGVRAAAQDLVRSRCLEDRQRLERQVDERARAMEASAAMVRGTVRAGSLGSIVGADLDALDVKLRTQASAPNGLRGAPGAGIADRGWDALRGQLQAWRGAAAPGDQRGQ